MSWWQVAGQPDDIIGDRPADILAGALDRAAALRPAAAPSSLKLSDFLGALEQAISAASSDLADPPPTGARVIAVTSRGEVASSPGADAWVAPLSAAIREVSAAYRQRFERNPSTTELLACFAFVLRPTYEGLSRLEISRHASAGPKNEHQGIQPPR